MDGMAHLKVLGDVVVMANNEEVGEHTLKRSALILPPSRHEFDPKSQIWPLKGIRCVKIIRKGGTTHDSTFYDFMDVLYAGPD